MDCQDVIANNLANVSTPGFKRSSVSFAAAYATEFQEAARSPLTPMPPHAPCALPALAVRRDDSRGMVQDTGAPANLAVEGPGSFVIGATDGERLTRSGDFGLDADGRLVNSEGSPVLGQSGPITIAGADWTVDSDGKVKVNGQLVDSLRIESAQGTPIADAEIRVHQGRLEASNVNAVQEMVSMIAVLRSYEANQRSIQAIDQTLDKVINQMNRFA